MYSQPSIQIEHRQTARVRTSCCRVLWILLLALKGIGMGALLAYVAFEVHRFGSPSSSSSPSPPPPPSPSSSSSSLSRPPSLSLLPSLPSSSSSTLLSSDSAAEAGWVHRILWSVCAPRGVAVGVDGALLPRSCDVDSHTSYTFAVLVGLYCAVAVCALEALLSLFSATLECCRTASDSRRSAHWCVWTLLALLQLPLALLFGAATVLLFLRCETSCDRNAYITCGAGLGVCALTFVATTCVCCCFSTHEHAETHIALVDERGERMPLVRGDHDELGAPAYHSYRHRRAKALA